eukprot:CAMPEP_0177538884 /NCGR_PEP_ID=MMETSP0369-20130122/58650_1 /TAXON_ID=447022 ORGANISM="Scrippsiella hangoei-like, Strain SHHI-4" /NCGR_SAMPLE_ID=MMETSP0369 /ASSEMBLY_ACC=CAM_ASM_000364 /LENGTH=32 /DNA_ID= /DNA_START= /DNA_END= /DNA_ORIENTATION=
MATPRLPRPCLALPAERAMALSPSSSSSSSSS